MEFITQGNRIAVENFDKGKLYTVLWKNGTQENLMCISIGADCVVFQGEAPINLFTLSMRNADTIDSIEPTQLGTTNYNNLINKPQINGVDLIGNKTGAQLGLASQSDLEDYATNASVVAGLATKQDALSSSQLQAVNSGITSELVTQIGTNTSAIAGKQDALSSSQLAAANSGITSEDVEQISTNKNNILNVNDKINEIVTTGEPVDYGIAAGYSVTKISGNANLSTNYDSANNELTFAKDASVNVTAKVNFTNLSEAGTYKIHVKTNKPTGQNMVFLYKNTSLVDTYELVGNEVDIDYVWDGTNAPIGVGFAIPYNTDSIKITSTAYNQSEESLLVIADNISSRVSTLENNDLPHIIGSTNTFVGKEAGKNTVETQVTEVDDGRYNTGVGHRAMEMNTQGDHCTALGFCALAKNTTGDCNTALGEDALYENTTGEYNTAIGVHALQNCNANANVAIGSNAARQITGSGNVFIGAEVMPTQRSINNAIVIGAYADTTTSGDIKIGNSNSLRLIFYVNGAERLIEFNSDGSVTWT